MHLSSPAPRICSPFLPTQRNRVRPVPQLDSDRLSVYYSAPIQLVRTGRGMWASRPRAEAESCVFLWTGGTATFSSAGRSAAWQRGCFGSSRSWVRIPPPRPLVSIE